MFKKIIAFFTALVSFSTLGSQVPEKADRNKEKAEQLVKQGNEALEKANYAEALSRYEEARSLLERTTDKAGLLNALRGLGNVYWETKKYNEAIDYYEKLLPIATEVGAKQISAVILARIGGAHKRLYRYQQALDYFQRSLSVCMDMGDEKRAADTHQTIGSTYISLGQYRQALKHFQEAAEIRRKLGDKRGEIASLIDIGDMHRRLDDYILALESYQRALEISRETGYQKELADSLSRVGLVYKARYQYSEALEHLQESLKIAKEIGDKVGVASRLRYIGLTYQSLGQYNRALEYLEESLTMRQELDDKWNQASSLNDVGAVHMALGNYAQALDCFDRSRQIGEVIKDKEIMATNLANIGIVYRRLGNYHKALFHLEKSLGLATELGNKNLVAAHYKELGKTYAGLGDDDQALKYYEEALKIQQAINDKRGVAETLARIGMRHLDHGHDRQALEHLQKSWKLNQEIGDKGEEASSLHEMALAYYRRKNLPEAERNVAGAINLSKETGRVGTLWSALHLKGAIFNDTGRTDEAIGPLTEAIAIIERMRGQVSGAEEKAGFLQDKVPVYEMLIGLLAQSNKPKEAFRYAERAKARAFLDLLTEARADVRKKINPQLLEKEKMTLARLLSLERPWQDETSKKEKNERKIQELKEQLRSVELDYENLKLEIRRANPDYAALKYPEPSTLAGAQKLLDDQAVLLEYVLGRERSFLFAVTKTDFAWYPLPGRDQLEKKVAALAALLGQPPSGGSATATYAGEAYDVYQLVVKPAEKQIAGKKTIIVAADGALALVPFQALLTQKVKPGAIDTKQLSYLVKEYDISYIPSASVLERLHQKEKKKTWEKTFVAFAPITFDEPFEIADAGSASKTVVKDLYRSGFQLGSLPYTKKEIEWIKELYGEQKTKLYMDKEASEEKVKESGLERYRYVHFATHGMINRDKPELSAIVLRNEGREDGFLHLAEVFNLDLNADLVALSACQSGAGKQMRGEGLIGLTRGFLYAGATSVLASLWNVPDQSTAYLMKEVYKNLEHATPAQALRQAQLEFIRGEQKELAYYSHPYHWSAFVVVGE